jgi:hypothetical protein
MPDSVRRTFFVVFKDGHCRTIAAALSRGCAYEPLIRAYLADQWPPLRGPMPEIDSISEIFPMPADEASNQPQTTEGRTERRKRPGNGRRAKPRLRRPSPFNLGKIGRLIANAALHHTTSEALWFILLIAGASLADVLTHIHWS